MNFRLGLALATVAVPVVAGVATAAPGVPTAPGLGCQAYAASGRASCSYVTTTGTIVATGVAEHYRVIVDGTVRHSATGAGFVLTGIKKGETVKLVVNTGVAVVNDAAPTSSG